MVFLFFGAGEVNETGKVGKMDEVDEVDEIDFTDLLRFLSSDIIFVTSFKVLHFLLILSHILSALEMSSFIKKNFR